MATRLQDLIARGTLKVGASTTPDSKALVDLESTTKGLLIPRMNTTQRDAITSPPTGLMIYNTSTDEVQFYDGENWGAVGTGGSGQTMTSQAFYGDDTWTAPAGVTRAFVRAIPPFHNKNASGGGHSLALIEDNTAVAWGVGAQGQLGDNSTDAKSSPIAVAGGRLFKQVAAGGGFSLGLTTDQAVYSWGFGTSGQLGDNSTTTKSSPVLVVGGRRIRSIAAGNNNAFAIDENGDLYSWGDNTNGKLGDDSVTNRSSPVLVVGGYKFFHVASNGHSLGIISTGDLYAWGNGTSGQLGDGTTTSKSSPVLVAGGRKFVYVACGAAHSLGITVDGDCYAWGSGTSGQLGDGTTTSKSSPVLVAGGYKFSQVACDQNASFGLTMRGDVYAWGVNTNGQLGDDSTTTKSSPVLVVGGYKFRQIAAEIGGTLGHVTAINTIGASYSWGSGNSGRLGDGTTTSKSSPVLVAGGYNYQLMPETWHEIALTVGESKDHEVTVNSRYASFAGQIVGKYVAGIQIIYFS